MAEQQTVARPFTLEGVGIHTGERGRVTVHPADAGAGRAFRAGGVLIPARADCVVDTTRCTVLGRDGVRVSTVEHLLSALHGLCVDNALIEVEGPEIPILDGSALPFAEAIQGAGVAGQGAPPRCLAPAAKVSVEGRGGRIACEPLPVESGAQATFRASTSFDAWPEGAACATAFVGQGPEGGAFQDLYTKQVAPARTFAFDFEVQALVAAGLARGGTLDNALVISPPGGFSSPLRVPQEWAWHKLLDLIGDLALLDARLLADVTAHRPGHRLNVEAARALLGEASAG